MTVGLTRSEHSSYDLDELMIIEAARHIRNGDVVMVGTGLPMVATTLAMKTHAPELIAVIESGPIDPVIMQTPISGSAPRAMHEAARLGSLREVLGCVLQRGLVDLGFIGGAQIDQFGNINSTVIGDYRSPKVRLPGSGGANDIACHARRLLIIVSHEKRRFPLQCDYVTSPGYLNGPGARQRAPQISCNKVNQKETNGYPTEDPEQIGRSGVHPPGPLEERRYVVRDPDEDP